VAAERKQLTCPSCGDRIYASDQQCLSCGAKLDEGRLAGDDAKVAVEATAAEPEMPPREPTGPAPMPQSAWPGAGEPEAVPQSPPLRSSPRTAGRRVSYNTGPGRWHPEQVTGSRGLFDNLTRSWVFLRESVLMAGRDKDLIIPSILSVIANLVLLGGLAAALYFTGNPEALFEDEGGAITLAGYILLFVAAFVGYLVSYFFTGMTVHLVDVHLRGEDARLDSALADSIRNIWGIIVLAAVSVVVNLIASNVRGKGRSSVRRAAAEMIERGWLAVTYLLLPVMILEDCPFLKAIERARSLHRHNILQIVASELGLMIAARVISIVFVIIAIAAVAGAAFLAPALLPVAIGGALLLFILMSAFTAYVRTAYYTCMYLWAVALETEGETAPAPAPLQPALQAG